MVTPFISQTRAHQRDGINVKRGNCSLSLTWSWVFSLTGLWCASPHFFGGIPLNKTTFCPIEELFWKQQRCKITLEMQLQHNSCLLGNNQEGGMSVDPHRWKGHSLTVFLFLLIFSQWKVLVSGMSWLSNTTPSLLNLWFTTCHLISFSTMFALGCVSESCSWEGSTYWEGEEWTPNPCSRCVCREGKARCSVVECQPVVCRPVSATDTFSSSWTQKQQSQIRFGHYHCEDFIS